MPVDYIGFAYAATVAAGGIIGYAKAGMTLSFIINGYLVLINYYILMAHIIKTIS